MATVTITLRIGRTVDGEPADPPADTVHLERLSPRARALALTVAAGSPAGGAKPRVWLRAPRPYGESWAHRPAAERAAYADPEHDARHALREWSAWDRFYADAPEDAYWYLERQAHKLPDGWRVIGPTPDRPVAEFDQPADDWDAKQVAAHLGIKVSGVRTTAARLGVRPYRHERGPDGVWRAVYAGAAVRWAHARRPGRGARTDLANTAGETN